MGSYTTYILLMDRGLIASRKREGTSRERERNEREGQRKYFSLLFCDALCCVEMEGLAESFAAQFTVSSEPNDTAAPHPR